MKPHPLKGKTIAAYVRVSSDKQDSTRQRDTIERWASNLGLPIGQWFVDDKCRNPRDKADKRLNFQRLLRLVEGGSFDAIIVDSQDRFGAKDAAQFFRFLDQLRECGCELWSVGQGNLSAGDDATVIGSAIGALTSTREQREKGQRSLSGRIKRARAGEYGGGYPPYGTDVCCYGANGKEKWRLVWVGQFKRIKINPDGSEEIYEGKNNSPAHDLTDTLRYVPTIRTERLKVLRDIFKWYDTEAISPAQIASRLNKLGVDSVYSRPWQKERIKPLLANPVYVGMPALNKRAGSRFWEFRAGEMRPVEHVNGKAKAGRKRTKEDFVFPEKPIFKPIISADQFNRVQRKLEKASKDFAAKVGKPRSPRTASFWLRNFVHCAKCGLPMRAWNANPDRKPYRSYFCSNYGNYGKDNPTGCRSNRVKAELVESLIDSYLAETHAKISELLQAHASESLESLGPLESELEAKRKELMMQLRKMRSFIHSAGMDAVRQTEIELTDYGKGEGLPNGAVVVPMPSTHEVFRHLYARRRPAIEARINELDAEHTALVDKVLALPANAKSAIAKANKRILELEAQIDALRADLENVADSTESLMSELEQRRQSILKARQVISSDAGYRRKAEFVRQVIERIDCHFVDAKGGGNQPRSQLQCIEVFPRIGSPHRCYPDEDRPGQGS